MNHLHLSFVEAIETLAAQYGLTVPRQEGQAPQQSNTPLYELMEQAATFYQKQLPQDKIAKDYLLNTRKLSVETIKRFQIGYAPDQWDGLIKQLQQAKSTDMISAGMVIKKEARDGYDRFRHRIMFPIRDRRGRVIAFGGRVMGDDKPKYLNSPETPIFHKSHEMYGLYEALQKNRQLDQLLVVEGYMDVVALAQHDLNFAVATLGTAVTTHHIKRLFQTCQRVVFCFDGDAAGRKAAWRSVEAVLPMLQEEWQMRFMFLPEGEDPDTLVQKEGTEKFLQRLKRAHSLSAFFLRYLSHQADMGTLDGRARFAKLAMDYVKKMSSPIMQNMLTEAIAKTASVDVITLQDGTAKPIEQPSASPKSRQGQAGKASPLRIAIMLLIQNPELAEHCDVALPNNEQPGWKLLSEIIALLKTAPKMTAGAIIEHWRDQPEANTLAKLASAEHIVPEGGLIAEFKDIMKHLGQQPINQQIEVLLGKARQQSITDAEKLQLQALLKERDKVHQG